VEIIFGNVVLNNYLCTMKNKRIQEMIFCFILLFKNMVSGAAGCGYLTVTQEKQVGSNPTGTAKINVIFI
jgi:hypothetical protein